ncbi:hypothetical protein CC2G_000872 [Coprinopsis cinerea AmutBmut pab1-1]|nr:hypothetical protein CC2G_000872 [Coprinopsis cinerea AmutBmut pab1-1]
MLGTAFELPKLTGRYLTAKLGDGNAEDSEYVEDGLTLVELDLICGAYECTDEHGRLAIRSCWPLVRYWEKDERGENYGRRCNRREAWYVSRLEEIKEGFVDKGNSSKRGKPFSYTEWKSCLRGQRPIRLFHQAVRQLASIYRVYRSSPVVFRNLILRNGITIVFSVV